MRTRDEFTGISYDITMKGCALHLSHNGSVRIADIPTWGIPLALEAERDGNVVLAEALLKELGP